MKILCTGGAGYIGAILVPRLLDAGHEVTVLDNFLYRQNSLAQVCGHPKFKVHRADVRDIKAVGHYTPKADVVIPLAALVGAPLSDLNPVDAELVNLRAPLALFDILSKDQLVVMPTTESVYGSNESICTEETPSNPLSTYGRHKVEVEKTLLDRGNSVSLRLATVFGMSPRMRLDLLINDFTWRALRDKALVVFEGQYRRTCVHVVDVARAFLHVLDNAFMVGGIFNVGSVSLTKLELCQAIKSQLPGFTFVEAEVGRDQDQRDYVVSDAKIRQSGFTPEVGLIDGIAELLNGYKMLSNNRYGNMP